MFPLRSGSRDLLIMDGNGFGSSGSIPESVVKLVCAYCEGSLRNPAGAVKSGDYKELEDIAADHFKRRVLNAEEMSLTDAGSIAQDVTRCVQLLNSIVLCDDCVSQFCISEAKVLKEQLAYLDKMTGPKDFGDILADPWLDLKRFAYAKLKNHQVSISRKLSLIQQNVSAQNESAVSSSNSVPAAGITTPEINLELVLASISTGSTGTTTTAQQTVSDSLNGPLSLCPTDTISIVDVSTDQVPPICQFAVSSGASNSSGPTSPNNHQKETENCTSDQPSDPPKGLKSTSTLLPPSQPPPEDKSSELRTTKGGRNSKQTKPVIIVTRPYAESAREASDDSSDDTSSIKSVPAVRKTPARAKKTLSKPETPTAKRAKLDVDSILQAGKITQKVDTPKADTPTKVVFAKKSDPSPTSPRSKGKPAAAVTPKSNPMNKPSRKSQKTENVIINGVENDTTSAATTIGPSSEFSAPQPPSRAGSSPKMPKNVLKVGGRVFKMNENSGSSDDDPDSSSDSD